MFGLSTICNAVSAISTFFALDQSLGNLISASASTIFNTSRAIHKVDDDASAVSSFFDVDSPTSHRRPTDGTQSRRSRRSVHRSSPSSSEPSTPKIVVDTSFLTPISSDAVETTSPPPRAPQWAQNLPVSATRLHPNYFEELMEIEIILRKRAARKEKKERVRI
ncbi:hypothetical protein P7C70_g1761, partial [Phenoliferia sp. Uapishka_3]